jgi:stress response protein YsnF
MCSTGGHRSPDARDKQTPKERVMPTSIIGLFETQDIARKVVSALSKAGFDDDKIETMTKAGIEETTDRLVEAGYDKDKARRYGEAVQKGGVLVVADVDDDKADEALSTMRRFDVLTPEALLEATSAQVIEESLEVGKTKVSAGKRLTTEVSEREVQETVTLHDESVEVERTKADKTLKPAEADKAFKETTVEVSGYTEKPVISKEARVVEEVSLNKNSGERDVTVSGTVRRQDVAVEDVDRKAKTSKKS